jgi:hypothetical protein
VGGLLDRDATTKSWFGVMEIEGGAGRHSSTSRSQLLRGECQK